MLEVNSLLSVLLSASASALLFSAAHHIGPYGQPYLTDFQKYRVALQLGISRFADGFYAELSAEARAMLSRETFVMMIAGAMVSYMGLLAIP